MMSRGNSKFLEVTKGSLVFTYCQVPIMYHLSNETKMEVHMLDGAVKVFDDRLLSAELSQEVFNRTGRIEKIECFHKF